MPSSDDGRAARWAGQLERRRREFVDAALSAIAEFGPEVSTQQIAERAGVARTRLYRHFDDAADLQTAVASRVVEMITRDFAPIWRPQGSPTQMITSAVGAHVGWLADHGHLYRYLTSQSLAARDRGNDAFTDVKTAIAQHLTLLFRHHLTAFGVGTRAAEPLAFGIVGLVESTAARWLDQPGDMTRDELTTLLSGWVWRLLDGVLRDSGIALDPEQPLPAVPAPRDTTDPVAAGH